MAGTIGGEVNCDALAPHEVGYADSEWYVQDSRGAADLEMTLTRRVDQMTDSKI